MGVTDEIKKKVSLANGTREQQLASRFNMAAYDLMNKFLTDVQSGKTELTGVNDFNQLYKMFVDVNHLTDGGNGVGGNGAPPELTVNEEESIENKLKVTITRKRDNDGNMQDVKQINVKEIEALSPSEVDDIADDRTEELNKRNGGFDID